MKTQQLSETETDDLHQAKQKSDLAEATWKTCAAQHNLLLAQTMNNYNMPISISAICMECGVLRSNANKPCPCANE